MQLRQLLLTLGWRQDASAACPVPSGFRTRRLKRCQVRLARGGPEEMPGIAQLFGGKSIELFCLPVLNSMIFRVTPGKIADIGLTRSTGWAGVPTTS